MAQRIGIEIGKNAVRAVSLKFSRKKLVGVRAVEVPILGSLSELSSHPAYLGTSGDFSLNSGSISIPPPSNLAEGDDAGLNDLATSRVSIAVKRMLSKFTGSLELVAPIPGIDVSSRHLQFPRTVVKRLDDLIPFELESQLPYDIEDAVVDHQLMDARLQGPKGGPASVLMLDVLACTIPRAKLRSSIENYLDLNVDPSELIPAPLAIEGLALLSSACAAGKNWVLVVGEETSELAALHEGRAAYTRSIDIGSMLLRRAQEGDSSAWNDLLRELKQSLSAYRLQYGEMPATFFVSSEDFGVDLEGWLSESLSMATQPIVLPAIEGIESSQIHNFAIPLGLAALELQKSKRVNFRKGDFQKKQALGFARKMAPLALALSGVVFLSLLFSFYARWSVARARYTTLSENLARVTRERFGEETTSLERARHLLQAGSDRADPLPRFTGFDALLAINNAIPVDIKHDVQRLHIELGDDRSGGHFELMGVVATIEERDRVLQALTEVQCFRELEPGPVQTLGEKRQYRIEGTILCPGDAPQTKNRRSKTQS